MRPKNVCSTKLSVEIVRLLDADAENQGITRSKMMAYIIGQYYEKEMVTLESVGWRLHLERIEEKKRDAAERERQRAALRKGLEGLSLADQYQFLLEEEGELYSALGSEEQESE